MVVKAVLHADRTTRANVTRPQPMRATAAPVVQRFAAAAAPSVAPGAETALRAANDKFERRFARMESLAQARGLELAQMSAAEWDALWNEAKLNGS